MTAQDWIEIAGLAVQLAGGAGAWRSLRGHQKKIASGQAEIHVLVNSKLDAALARGVQLADTLKDAGVDVPEAPCP